MNIIFYYNYVYIFYTCYLLILASRSPPLLTRISRLQAGFCGGQSPTPPKGSHQHPALSELCPGLPPWEGAAGVHGKARGGRGASPPAVRLVEELSARPLDHPTLLQQSVMRRWTVCGINSISTGFCSVFRLAMQAVPSATWAETTTLPQRTRFCQILHSGPQRAARPRKGSWPSDHSRKNLLPEWLAAVSPSSLRACGHEKHLKAAPAGDIPPLTLRVGMACATHTSASGPWPSSPA